MQSLPGTYPKNSGVIDLFNNDAFLEKLNYYYQQSFFLFLK